ALRHLAAADAAQRQGHAHHHHLQRVHLRARPSGNKHRRSGRGGLTMNIRKHALLSATALLALGLGLAACGEEKKEEQAAAPAAEQPAAQPAAPAAEATQPAATETQQAATTEAAPATAPTGADVKVGILFDITGPIANFIPPM